MTYDVFIEEALNLKGIGTTTRWRLNTIDAPSDEALLDHIRTMRLLGKFRIYPHESCAHARTFKVEVYEMERLT